MVRNGCSEASPPSSEIRSIKTRCTYHSPPARTPPSSILPSISPKANVPLSKNPPRTRAILPHTQGLGSSQNGAHREGVIALRDPTASQPLRRRQVNPKLALLGPSIDVAFAILLAIFFPFLFPRSSPWSYVPLSDHPLPIVSHPPSIRSLRHLPHSGAAHCASSSTSPSPRSHPLSSTVAGTITARRALVTHPYISSSSFVLSYSYFALFVSFVQQRRWKDSRMPCHASYARLRYHPPRLWPPRPPRIAHLRYRSLRSQSPRLTK